MARYKYMMYVYKNWDRELLMKVGSNNLEYFNKNKHKDNYSIVIKEGRKIVYDERDRG